MKYQTIAEIYAGNEKIRERLKALLAELPEEKAKAITEGEKWCIAQIVEHLSMVDEGTIKICSKLLRKAQESGQTSDGAANISDNFLQRGSEIAGMKVEAPTFVQPTGERSIAESLTKLDENTERANELRALFESVDGAGFTFPHPFFGDITAQEWLALKGGHEMRHIRQIERLLGAMDDHAGGE